MIISVVLCEGVHDIAFISKILCAYGCMEYKRKIKDYPFPINDQIKNNYAKDAIGEKIIGSGPDSPFVPKAVYTDGRKLIFFHNLNGDADTEKRYELIEQYQKNKIALKFKNPDEIEKFEFYLFYDADDLGVEGRLDWIKNRFAGKFRIAAGDIAQGKKVCVQDITLGTYVFHKPHSNAFEQKNIQKGTLEDQLLALMHIDNGALFQKAAKFLDANILEPERTKEYDAKQDKYVGSKKYKPKKSQISVAGQLQFSGMNNSVIILKSDYIKKQTILQDIECKRIAEMILE